MVNKALFYAMVESVACITSGMVRKGLILERETLVLCAMYNYFFSTIGHGSKPPLHLKRVRQLLGLPLTLVPSTPAAASLHSFRGNLALFQLFSLLLEQTGDCGSAAFFWKADGVGRTIGLTPSVAHQSLSNVHEHLVFVQKHANGEHLLFGGYSAASYLLFSFNMNNINNIVSAGDYNNGEGGRLTFTAADMPLSVQSISKVPSPFVQAHLPLCPHLYWLEGCIGPWDGGNEQAAQPVPVLPEHRGVLLAGFLASLCQRWWWRCCWRRR